MAMLITIPDMAELKGRLAALPLPDHTRDGLIPLILRSAGEKLTWQGVVMALHSAVFTYTDGLDEATCAQVNGVTVDLIVDAIFDDKPTRVAVKEQLAKGFAKL